MLVHMKPEEENKEKKKRRREKRGVRGTKEGKKRKGSDDKQHPQIGRVSLPKPRTAKGAVLLFIRFTSNVALHDFDRQVVKTKGKEKKKSKTEKKGKNLCDELNPSQQLYKRAIAPFPCHPASTFRKRRCPVWRTRSWGEQKRKRETGEVKERGEEKKKKRTCANHKTSDMLNSSLLQNNLGRDSRSAIRIMASDARRRHRRRGGGGTENKKEKRKRKKGGKRDSVFMRA